ncbi:hypothetical protein GCWU000246_00377 [Jonquetella anthropi E3_33 E1]|nr:hypothetical protein GCWU000246_00377 [Jonquetella anthropi E3_33 E1]
MKQRAKRQTPSRAVAAAEQDLLTVRLAARHLPTCQTLAS